MSSEQPLRIVQLTDSHLFADPQERLLGLETAFSLNKVIELVLAEYPDPDLLLCTGDISQDGSEAAYRRFRDRIAELNAPSYWFGGNHDRIENMRAVLGAQAPELTQVVRQGGWQLILLDSQIPGKVPGRLAADQLELLDTALTEAPELPALVSFHHQPVTIDTKWLAPLGLKNADELFAIVDRHPQVRVLLWGHIHQEYDQQRNGVRLLATPSTCVQFTPGSVEFSADTRPPGYRWLELYPDGSVDTAVSRVDGIKFEVDYSVKGY